MLSLKYKQNELIQPSIFLTIAFSVLFFIAFAASPAVSQDSFSNVELVGRIPFGSPKAVAADNDKFHLDNYLYGVDGIGLRIIDVSDSDNPTLIGFFYTPGESQGVCVSGDYAYVADGNSGLRIISVSNPEAPFEKGYCDAIGFAKEVFIVGNYAYVCGDGLYILDVSNPSAPYAVFFFEMSGPGLATDVFVVGNCAYVVRGGLYIVDVSNPSAPFEKGYFDPGLQSEVGIPSNVYVSGCYAFWRIRAGVWISTTLKNRTALFS